MITEEEYLKAQAIIDEYHRERQQQADWDLEDDEPDNFDEDDLEEQLQNDRLEKAFNCTCGAWVVGKDGGGYHVADCICGAE